LHWLQLLNQFIQRRGCLFHEEPVADFKPDAGGYGAGEYGSCEGEDLGVVQLVEGVGGEKCGCEEDECCDSAGVVFLHLHVLVRPGLLLKYSVGYFSSVTV
jgi:hypothetical protein